MKARSAVGKRLHILFLPVLYTAPPALLDSAGVNVDCCPERGVQWSPPDYAVLDSSRVKSPERGIQWTPLDCVHQSPLEWELIPRYKIPYLGRAPLT